MHFRVLGPILVEDDAGLPVRINGLKLRALLAVLLASHGARVGTFPLIDAMWGERPPRSAAANLQTYVWTLRGLLPVTQLGGRRIERDRDGYRLLIEESEIDQHQFCRLADRGAEELAAGQITRCAATLRPAMALWRGEPFEDVSWAVAAESSRLTERRWLAQEDLLEAQIRLGGHRAAVVDLLALTRQQPLREQWHALLMVALYRCDRRAEALRAFAHVSLLLDRELGIRPCRTIQDTYQRILLDDLAAGAAGSNVARIFGAPQ